VATPRPDAKFLPEFGQELGIRVAKCGVSWPGIVVDVGFAVGLAGKRRAHGYRDQPD
jgi:hypothetical protein